MQNLPKRTLKNVFLSSVQKFKDEIAFSYVDEPPLSFGEIEFHSNTLMNALMARGVQKGDRVAILSENSPRWAISYFAVANMGAVTVPILPDFHKSEVHHILRNSGASVLFISSKLVHKLLEAEISNLEYVVILDDVRTAINSYSVETYKDLISGQAPSKKPKKITPITDMIEEDDLLEILYTSGTTGHSKGVMLTHRNIISNALSATTMISILPSDRLVSILPMSHSYESTCGFIAPFMMGAKVYYIKGLPTAQTLLPAVQQVKPTILLSVPLIMDKIYKKKVLSEINAKAFSRMLYKISPMKKMVNQIAGKKLYEAFGGQLRLMVFGGAATPIEVEQFLTEGKFPYTTGYGLTESAPLLTANPIDKVKHQSCGMVVPEVVVKIQDPDPATGIGEIIAKGPNIMRGYYKNDEATRKAFTEDGWLITGDRGYFDEEGYLFIKGRSKNLIVGPSGENIYPEEIEFHLSQHPYVLESLVFEKDGRIVARVHLDYDGIDKEMGLAEKDESESSKIISELLEQLRQEVNTKVASYSRIHKLIEQREEFEKTPTKKIKRYLYTT